MVIPPISPGIEDEIVAEVMTAVINEASISGHIDNSNNNCCLY